MNNTATTRTIHVLCKADGTPIMRRLTLWPQNAEERDRTVPVCFGGTRRDANVMRPLHYGAVIVNTVTWEVK